MARNLTDLNFCIRQLDKIDQFFFQPINFDGVLLKMISSRKVRLLWRCWKYASMRSLFPDKVRNLRHSIPRPPPAWLVIWAVRVVKICSPLTIWHCSCHTSYATSPWVTSCCWNAHCIPAFSSQLSPLKSHSLGQTARAESFGWVKSKGQTLILCFAAGGRCEHANGFAWQQICSDPVLQRARGDLPCPTLLCFTPRHRTTSITQLLSLAELCPWLPTPGPPSQGLRAASGMLSTLPQRCHVNSQCGKFKSIASGLKIISTVSRRIYTTCFSPLKSDCSAKTYCSASSRASCFQTGKERQRGRKNPSYKEFLLGEAK